MGDRHDYVALEWVKGEIAETLKQARQALEAYVEAPQDSTRMRFCMTYVHQVHGTLQMVEFFGAALLAEEMEQLARALLEERVANRAEALEVLMQAILQMPVYLDRIQSARRDLPMVVLPLLNDLRAARGEKLLSETSLFAPDLSERTPILPSESVERLRTEELPVLLRKMRQMLQVALVGVIRNQDLPTNLGYMARVFARLESLCKDAPLGALWQITSGMIEGLASGAVSNGASVRTLLRQVDKEFKRLVEQGVDGLNQPAPDELIKNLLFYVAKAPADTPRLRALRELYRLDDALPDMTIVDQERAQLSGPDRGAMRSVVAALCEELVRVKDSLDLFVRSDRRALDDLASLHTPLKQIADTLAVLGFAQPRKIIVDQTGLVQALTSGLRQPDDATLMDIAGALLYVEATLAGMVGTTTEEQDEARHLPTTDVAQIHQLVIKEARTALEQAKDAIIEFIASQWNHDHLARVPELLTQARGGLAMIPLQRAAALLDACNRYIQEQLLALRAVPDWQSLDTLADAITSVEYYLERLSEDCGSQGDLILDVAEESLQHLGYPLASTSLSVSEKEQPQPESDLSGDPLDEIEFLLPEADPEPAEMASHRSGNSEEQRAGDVTLGENELPAVTLPANDAAAAVDYLPPAADLDGSALELPTLEFEILDEAAPATSWSAVEIADLGLPEITLPPLSESLETPEQAPDLEQIMAAPVLAINPPAQDVPPSLLPPPEGEEPVDDELAEVFIEEAAEVLETIREQLPAWLAEPDDKAVLGEVRRAFHTLKGSGRMVRALIVGELAWSIENLLNRVLDRSIGTTEAVKQVVVDVVALLPALVEEFAAHAQRQRSDVDQLAACAHALAKGEPLPNLAPAGAVEQPEPSVDAAGEREPASDGLDPQLLEIFRNEAEAHLTTLVDYLADCAQRLPQPVTDALQRALHTLKGSAHMAGILPMAEIATPLEKLVKEFKNNLIQIELADAQLLHDAEQLLRQGLDNLQERPLAPIAGAPEFLARVQALHQARLTEAGVRRESAKGEARDPSLIAAFLSEGMNILLDAADLLQRWREHPTERQELSALLQELSSLGHSAQMADLPQVDALCQALLKLYGVVQDGRLAVDAHFFDTVEEGHEALVGMMDQVAAALQVTAQPQLVERLEALAAQAIDTLAAPEETLLPAVQPLVDDGYPALAHECGESGAADDSFDQDMVDIFLDEAVDLLESAGEALERWLSEPTNQLALSALLRDLHTLKGGARMAGVRPVGDLAHELESLYEGLSDGRYAYAPDLAALLQRSHDQLALQLEQLQSDTPMSAADELVRTIRAYRQGDLLGAVADDLVGVPDMPQEHVSEPVADADAASEELSAGDHHDDLQLDIDASDAATSNTLEAEAEA
ncbi:chemotaxis protein CheA, partial [Stutzerimonas degradans]